MSPSTNTIVRFDIHAPITVGTIHSTDILDGANVSQFGSEVIAYVETHAGIHLLLDFNEIKYMSSAGLTELLRINESLKKDEGSVRLCGLTKDIRKVFEITNLEQLFVIHDDDSVDAATKRFERSLAVAAKEDAWAHPEPGD